MSSLRNFLSGVLVVAFMISCFCFVSATAEEGDSDIVETVANTTTTAPLEPETTTAADTTAETTTGYVEETTTPTYVVDTTATATESATKKKTTAKKTTKKKTEAYTYKTTEYYYTTTEYVYAGTKTTRPSGTEITTTKITTVKKNIDDFTTTFKVVKWVSLAAMIACVVLLVVVNLKAYKQRHPNGKPKTKRKGKK